MTSYRQSETAVLLAEFHTFPGGPGVDVTGLTITITPVGGGAAVVGPTSSGVSHEGTGIYSYPWAIPSDQDPGDYVVLWSADDDVEAVETITVVAFGGTLLYATLADLRSYMGLTGTGSDDQLGDALLSVSREIDRYCGRRFYGDTEASARLFYPQDVCVARVDDFYTIEDLEVATDEAGDGTYATVWSATDYQLEPLGGVVDGETGWPYCRIRAVSGRRFCYWSGRAPLQVTARWGWAAVPDPVRQACLIMAAETVKLSEAPFGVASFDQFGPIRVRVNPMTERKLNPYRRDPVLIG